MRLKIKILLCLLLFTGMGSFAQTPGKSPISPDSIQKEEMRLKAFADSLMNGSTVQVREASLAAFNPMFIDLLSQPSTFDYPFDSLKTVSKILSPDKQVKIYTWIYISRNEEAYKYYGIIQRKSKKTGEVKLIGLTDVKIPVEDAIQSELKSDSWYGAVYYEILQSKSGKNTLYTLLGWQGNDRLTTRKVIDVLSFDVWNNITFGAPVFLNQEGRKQYRMIFEYSADAVMTLRYDKRKKMIIFDHLSPSTPAAKGQFRYYGPDFTYDGLYFKKGLWRYKANLDVRNPTE